MDEKTTGGIPQEPLNPSANQTSDNDAQTNREETLPVTGESSAAQVFGSAEALPEQPQAADLPEADAGSYAYRWDYDSQKKSDDKRLKRQKKKSAMVYAIVMSVAFLLCLVFLGGVIYLNDRKKDQALTTAEVAELVNPSTVLIYAANNGYGTGFFVRSDGYIVTNCHVVNGAEKVMVTLYDGTELEAAIKWSSAADDLAILKIAGKNYPAVTIGNSDALKVGDTAIAIGNPAGNVCPWTTTQGIISSTARDISIESATMIIDMTLLQTDAQVNPGNSGGPLCNDRGEVIGIVVRKMTSYEGLGLAIPINGAMELVNAYLETGSTSQIQSTVSRVRPTIGIQAAAVQAGDLITESYQAPVDGILVLGITETVPQLEFCRLETSSYRWMVRQRWI